jgi:hypothetical protein
MLSLGEMFRHVKTIFIRFINETIFAKSYWYILGVQDKSALGLKDKSEPGRNGT